MESMKIESPVFALSKVPGVIAAQADYQTGSARITADTTDPPDMTAVGAAIEQAGYSLVAIEHQAKKP